VPVVDEPLSGRGSCVAGFEVRPPLSKGDSGGKWPETVRRNVGGVMPMVTV
jgi:hypothetical protein